MKTLTGKLIFLVPDSCPPDSPTFIYVQQPTKVPKIGFLSLPHGRSLNALGAFSPRPTRAWLQGRDKHAI